MKTPLFSLLSLALFTATVPAIAAEPTPPPAPAASAPGQFASKLQDIAAQLNLTEEQKAQIGPILQQEMAELRALKEEAKAARREKLQRFRDINQKASAQIRPLLTPEQQKKYDELRAAARVEFKQKMKERRAAGGN